MTVNDVTKVKMKCFVKKVGKLRSQTLAIDGQTESESDALGPKNGNVLAESLQSKL